MNEKFKFTDALAIRDNAGEKTWVPSGEAWTEIHRLQNEFARVEEQKAVALEANQNLYDKTFALQNQIDALNRDYRAACNQRDSWKREAEKKLQEVQTLRASSPCALERESHDKLIALQTQVLTFFTVSELFTRGIFTFAEMQKVFAELQRLAVE